MQKIIPRNSNCGKSFVNTVITSRIRFISEIPPNRSTLKRPSGVKIRREVKDEDYEKFYQNFTLDFEKPLNRLHLSIDAPFQMYALLYIPSKPERTMFSLRKEDGLQLFARKVLIQDYCTNLLPRYYRFIEGVIDSEDIPLNVSREERCRQTGSS